MLHTFFQQLEELSTLQHVPTVTGRPQKPQFNMLSTVAGCAPHIHTPVSTLVSRCRSRRSRSRVPDPPTATLVVPSLRRSSAREPHATRACPRALEILLEGIHESSFLRFFRIDPQFGQNRAKPQPRATAHTTKTTFSTVAGPRARTTYHICSNSCWKVSQLPTKTVAGVPNHIWLRPRSRCQGVL